MVREPGSEEHRMHGRYYAEYVRAPAGDPQDQLQALLDQKDPTEWHLVGVAGGLPDGGIIFFWDTERPSFGRSSRQPG